AAAGHAAHVPGGGLLPHEVGLGEYHGVYRPQQEAVVDQPGGDGGHRRLGLFGQVVDEGGPQTGVAQHRHEAFGGTVALGDEDDAPVVVQPTLDVGQGAFGVAPVGVGGHRTDHDRVVLLGGGLVGGGERGQSPPGQPGLGGDGAQFGDRHVRRFAQVDEIGRAHV